MIYTTVSGDTFDSIAKKELGDWRYVEQLIEANRGHIATVIFSAGVELVLPEIDGEEISSTNENLPPWRRD